MRMQPGLVDSRLPPGKMDTRFPLRFVAGALVLIYVLQYPLSRLFAPPGLQPAYDWLDWLEACVFVIWSSLLLVLSLRLGLLGRARPAARLEHRLQPRRPLNLALVLLVFAVFFLWSYLMLRLRIGMTIFADIEPLPFRLVGLLFYGRLFLQPIVLAYISSRSSASALPRKTLLLVLLLAVGSFACLTSGSRFVAILFATPLLLLFSSGLRYLFFALAALLFITIATVTRNLFLPFWISDAYVSIYANEIDRSAILAASAWLPFQYILDRVMGMGTVLMTLKFGRICPTFLDSFLSFLNAFLPFNFSHEGSSIKNIYGLDDDSFGGMGLDLFSNYWFSFGGSILLYVPGLALVGFLAGKCYRQLCILGGRIGFPDLPKVSFVAIFLFVLEGRSFLLPGALLVTWFLSRQWVLGRLSMVSRVRLRMS